MVLSTYFHTYRSPCRARDELSCAAYTGTIRVQRWPLPRLVDSYVRVATMALRDAAFVRVLRRLSFGVIMSRFDVLYTWPIVGAGLAIDWGKTNVAWRDLAATWRGGYANGRGGTAALKCSDLFFVSPSVAHLSALAAALDASGDEDARYRQSRSGLVPPHYFFRRLAAEVKGGPAAVAFVDEAVRTANGDEIFLRSHRREGKGGGGRGEGRRTGTGGVCPGEDLFLGIDRACGPDSGGGAAASEEEEGPWEERQRR